MRKASREQMVIKRVDGRGGDGVWVGKYTTAQAWAALRDAIVREPAAFISQDFMPLSEVNGMILDRRLLALVDPKGVLVSPTVVVRANVKTGDGKVNLSLTGRGLPTFVVEDVGCGGPYRSLFSRLVRWMGGRP